MQIKHKLLLWFAALTSALLLTLAGYVYVSTARFRAQTFAERLAHRVGLSRQALAAGGSLAGGPLAALPEQAQAVYSPANRRVFASGAANDFRPSAAWLARVRQLDSLAFTYPGAAHLDPRQGVAVAYGQPGTAGQYVAVVTAYDQEGYAQQQGLRWALLLGGLGAVALVGALGWLFAVRALAPLTLLIGQLRRA